MERGTISREFVKILAHIERVGVTEKVKCWLEHITAPEYGLVKSLSNIFVNPSAQPAAKQQALHMLRLLNSYQRVADQFTPEFAQALLDYSIRTPVHTLTSEAVLLLVDALGDYTHKDVMKQSFLQLLFDCLEYVESQAVFRRLLELILLIACAPQNNAADYCLKHPNCSSFLTGLCEFLPEAAGQQRTNSLQVFKRLLENTSATEAYLTDSIAHGLWEALLPVGTLGGIEAEVLTLLRQYTSPPSKKYTRSAKALFLVK